ncbi:MAG: ABC transporter substrate-binding protein [Synergistaceae bacterium]|nr:ABC transporter substrate-binding protein [Synergistaceae bacterium]MBR1658039.1 ABC transporter substrate-binding protein [Synergistaceae bacterium]
MKRILLAVMFMVLAVSSAMAAPSGKVMLYSSMQEDQLVAIKKGFEAKYPDIVMDYYFAGTGRVITKIATEHQAGQVAADVIWVGDPSDYLSFKKEGILEKYSSPEASAIAAKFIDPDGFYTGARMMNMGIGYNSALVTPEDAPKSWNDLLDPKWEGQIVMTDPASAGTTKYFVAALLASPKYGEEYFKKLRANGCELESGTTATHNQVAASAYQVGIMLDYVSHNLMAQGSPIGFTYLPEDLISIFSPIGLVKGSANNENGKLLYDFILSKDGQKILIANNLLSVRDDVEQKDVDVEAIAKSAMTVDLESLAANSDKILSTFDNIFKK